ncbi:MAG: hypothetical protein JW919_00680 [Candidatus Omnitrophica bacterium]|nr:hypothetical protein [Candidatus Omnitrophota bacterium]
MKKNVILFNPVGIVHDRNIQIFKKLMPEFHFRAIYNPNFSWFSDPAKLSCDDAVWFGGRLFQRPSREAFDDVKAVILFTAQLRTAQCNLVEEAFLRKIPVIAVEEVSQMMLSQAAMNNYILPVDNFFVASEYEKSEFMKLGVPSSALETVGGVFRYKKGETIKKASKSEFGLSESKRVATLSLDLLAPNGETPFMRKRILEILSKGLTEEYELLVKPHPAESMATTMKFLRTYAPRARMAPGPTPIDRVLDVTDILFNRGTSQVIIDAMQRKIPVVPVPICRRTIFDGSLDEIIVRDETDVPRVISIIHEKGVGIYDSLIEAHLSIPPEKSAMNAVSKIREVIDSGAAGNEWIKWADLSLFWAWMGYRAKARRVIERLSAAEYSNPDAEDAIKGLVTRRAGREDLALLKRVVSGAYKENILKSLWIDMLYSKKMKLSSDDVEWLKDFPPDTNKFHFLRFALMLGWLYKRSGFRKEASLLAESVHGSFGFIKGVSRWSSAIDKDESVSVAVEWFRERLDHDVKSAVKDFISR